MEGVIDQILLLLHFHFGRCADLDDRNTACQLGDALLQFLLVVIGGRFLNLRTDLGNPGCDVGLLAGAVHDSGVLLVDHHALGAAHLVEIGGVETQSHFFRDHSRAGQDGDILQHGFAAIAETGSFDSGSFQDATQVVDHQRCQCFALDVFGNQQQRPSCFGNGFKYGQQIANVADFLVDQHDEGVVEFNLHLFLVIDEVGRQVAAVELHAFYDFQLIFQRFTFLDGNHAVAAHFVHRLGQDLTDIGVPVGRHGGNLTNGLVVVAGLGHFLQLFGGGNHGAINTALEVHRVHAGGDGLVAFADQCLGQHGGGGGAITGHIGGFGRHFFHHLGAHVFEPVLQFDFLGDRNAVLGHTGGAKGFFEYHIAAFRAERYLHGVRQNVYPCQHTLTGVAGKLDGLGTHAAFSLISLCSTMAKISDSLMIR